eukprot:TRINITY_DN10545_c0_g1_i2.p1 TRINITY_DN10545_c0_g1~~TRINITY_DN10545_c0_g1_i2.p1  ORF type:complete len:125 (+),score=3.38 TRINITY_DN10545_c0_g1_i2:1894-2268(+)
MRFSGNFSLNIFNTSHTAITLASLNSSTSPKTIHGFTFMMRFSIFLQFMVALANLWLPHDIELQNAENWWSLILFCILINGLSFSFASLLMCLPKTSDGFKAPSSFLDKPKRLTLLLEMDCVLN